MICRMKLLLSGTDFVYMKQMNSRRIMKLTDVSKRFFHSQIILEVVTERYTKGIMKKIVSMKMKRQLGIEAGSSYDFGINKGNELESYGDGIKVIDEWSYFEDPDSRLKVLKYLGFSRKQWTVTATINESIITLRRWMRFFRFFQTCFMTNTCQTIGCRNIYMNLSH